MQNVDEREIKIRLAKKIGVVRWIGYAFFVGLTIALSGQNLVIPYILSALGLASWHLFTVVHNIAADLHNELAVYRFMSEVSELNIEGTLLDTGGLTKDMQDILDSAPKDAPDGEQ